MGALAMALENSWYEPAVATDGAGDNGNGSPSLKERIWFTLGILVVYRLGTYLPIPNVDPVAGHALLEQRAFGLFGLFNMFSGGALGRMSMFALSILPYVSALVIMHLAATVFPRLKALGRQGAAGRRKTRQYICYVTVLLCVIQSYGLSVGLESMSYLMSPVVFDTGLVFRLTTIATLTAGTMLLVWLAEQITRRGIGNGIALIILAGVAANLPQALGTMLTMGRTGALSGTFIIVALVMALALTVFMAFMENAKREVVVVYSERQSGTRIFDGGISRLTLKPNLSGIAPPILASSVLVPLTVVNFPGGTARREWLGEMTNGIVTGPPVYLAIYAGLIVFFAFFYSKALLNPTDIADSLKQYDGFVPGIRPGKNTAEHLNFIQTRLSVIGAAYLAFVCLPPEVLISYYVTDVPFYFGGTSFFIIVFVALQIIRQIRAELLASSR